MLHKNLIILPTISFLFGVSCCLADQETPSDRTYIAFHSAPFAMNDSGFNDLDYPDDETNNNVYSFAPIIVSFNSKPLILDVGYVKARVPYTRGSLGVRVLGIGPVSSYASFFFSRGSTSGSYSDSSGGAGHDWYYWEGHSTSFDYSETTLTGGVTLKYTYGKKIQAWLCIGYGYRLYEENVLHLSSFESYFDGDYDYGIERKETLLDGKPKVAEVSARSIVGLYGPFGVFFDFNVIPGRSVNTEAVKPRRMTALFGISCII